jgi:flagellin
MPVFENVSRRKQMIINHNMSALYAQRQLKNNDLSASKDMEKLASGLRITRAADDASGLAVSEKLRSQIRGLNQAGRNAENGISFIQATEGYLEETTDVLQRLRELSVQAANGIYSDEDRMQIQVEVSQLVNELDRVASHAQFNGMNVLTGRFARSTGLNFVESSMWFHIGANMDQRVQVFIGTMTSSALKIRQFSSREFINYETPDGANKSIGILDDALKVVNKQRADLGAYQNRLEMAVKGIGIGAENMQSAESRIRDADMAHEMVSYTRDNILIQSSTAMLGQANAKTQSVLRLLQ